MKPFSEYQWLRRLRVSRLRSAYIVSRRAYLSWLAKRVRAKRALTASRR